LERMDYSLLGNNVLKDHSQPRIHQERLGQLVYAGGPDRTIG
jgi:hypothetical protein